MRLAAILLGYCCAMLAAGFFLAAIFYSQIDMMGYAQSESIGADPFFESFFVNIGDAWMMGGFYAAVLVGGPVLAVMAGSYSFFPALILIVLGEIRGWRSSLPYCIGGLVIGLLALGTGMFLVVNGQPFSGGTALMTGAFAGAGVVGGFVYWLVAGRNAGRFLERPVK